MSKKQKILPENWKILHCLATAFKKMYAEFKKKFIRNVFTKKYLYNAYEFVMACRDETCSNQSIGCGSYWFQEHHT